MARYRKSHCGRTKVVCREPLFAVLIGEGIKSSGAGMNATHALISSGRAVVNEITPVGWMVELAQDSGHAE